MTILIAAETLLVILLAVVVVALLRSHAEILRRLDGAPGGLGSDPELAPRRDRDGELAAHDIAGSSLDGAGVQIGLGPGASPTLIAFLSSGCATCDRFWREFSAPGGPAIPGGGRVVIVTRDSSHESPRRLRELAPAGVPLVMSSLAWESYAVPTSPYFVYVDGGSGEIAGEGAASGWEQVLSLLGDALEDQGEAKHGRSGAERARRIDSDLERAGIGPGHPSLYPHGSSPAGATAASKERA